MFSEQQRLQLLALARLAITEKVLNDSEVSPPDDDYLAVESGVFVTLTIEHELRGCIGFPQVRFRLGDAIIRAAVLAATEDPRFPPVSPAEVSQLHLEVSVLSPARAISDPSEIQVGEHGIILTLGHARGLLLPQVPLEHGWNRDQYLRAICHKAGVRDEAWKDPRAKLEVFTAEVFGE